MSYKMNCPHCNHEHELTDYLADGYLEDDEYYCDGCNKPFEFLIEFDPVVYVDGDIQV